MHLDRARVPTLIAARMGDRRCCCSSGNVQHALSSGRQELAPPRYRAPGAETVACILCRVTSVPSFLGWIAAGEWGGAETLGRPLAGFVAGRHRGRPKKPLEQSTSTPPREHARNHPLPCARGAARPLCARPPRGMQFLRIRPTQRREDDLLLPVIQGHVSSTSLRLECFPEGGCGALRSFLTREGRAAWAAPTLTQEDLHSMLLEGKQPGARGAVGAQANTVTWIHVSRLEEFMQQPCFAKYSGRWGGSGAFTKAIRRCLPFHCWTMPGMHEGQGVELEMEAEVGQEEAEGGVEEAEGAHPQQRQLVVDLVDLVSTSEEGEVDVSEAEEEGEEAGGDWSSSGGSEGGGGRRRRGGGGEEGEEGEEGGGGRGLVLLRF